MCQEVAAVSYPQCGCMACRYAYDRVHPPEGMNAEFWSTGVSAVMVLCPDCGNKRCPHASHHIWPCSGSNEAGQLGSDYGLPLPFEDN